MFKKLGLLILMLAAISFCGDMIALPNGIYSFTSEDGESVQIGINNMTLTIGASGNYQNAYLKVDDEGDMYYTNKAKKLVVAFKSPCVGVVNVRGTSFEIYNNVPICN